MAEALAPAALPALRAQLARQVAHWTEAAAQLADLGQLAPVASWRALERYLGQALEATLRAAIEGLRKHGLVLKAQLLAAELVPELRRLRQEILVFRRRFLAVEVMLDFYGDAINTRTSPRLANLLGACDFLATESMRALLEPLGHPTPTALCYLDKGLGASILKAGLRLWDGRSISPVAAIKIVRHNLPRPTSLVHEAGHQFAHIAGWTEELAAALASVGAGPLGAVWSRWASEIAADAVAFVHTGYAALAALHDVIAEAPAWVLRLDPIDPHPSGYIRTLLGRQMCRQFFGAGPWDALAEAWQQSYPLSAASPDARALFEASLPLLPRIVELIFETRYRAFRGKSLVQLLDPARVKPEALLELERRAGAALYRSSDWTAREALRLLALSGYRAAVQPARLSEIVAQQEEWMQRLGDQRRAA